MSKQAFCTILHIQVSLLDYRTSIPFGGRAMRLKRTLILSAALVILAFAAAVPAGAQGGRQVWAFYMGFWTGNGWGSSPEVMDDQPSIGLYDSRDPGVGGMQIDQAKG